MKDFLADENAKIKGLDSIAKLITTGVNDTAKRRQLYLLTGKYAATYPDFAQHDVTMQQIKYAGDLKLLNEHHVADSLINYNLMVDNAIAQLNSSEQFHNDMLRSENDLFDYSILWYTKILHSTNLIVPPFDYAKL